MPRLNESTRLERRARIATAALTCFARDGFAKTSMADIIRESGLSSGSIYSHFESKAEILRFAVSSVLEARFLDSLGEPTDGSPVTPGDLFSRLLGSAAMNGGQAEVLLQVWAQVPGDRELAPLARDNLAHLNALATAALIPWAKSTFGDDAEQHATAAADAVITAMLGYAVRLAVDPSTNAEQLRRSITTTLSPMRSTNDIADANDRQPRSHTN
jgi:AcrR family transcriptional regulator